jgi:hypothetical protein
MSQNELIVRRIKPIDLGKGPVVMLFYDGYERRARRDKLIALFCEIKRPIRYIWRLSRGRQLRTGFYTQFLNLVSALKHIGCDVHINDYSLADQYPNYPIGAAGYPSILDHIPKNHPVLFGPGDFGAPDDFKEMSKNFQSAYLLCFSEWISIIYEQWNPGLTKQWFAGIDIDAWRPDTTKSKPIDCLIYDKIRWQREKLIPDFYEKIKVHLDKLGLAHKTIRYGEHTSHQYRENLQRSKSFIFLCEHETQGLAYQEAMSMNIPIFAWDEGKLSDNELKPFATNDLVVTSVPYFSEDCGIRFQKENFHDRFGAFWNELNNFKPREYVEKNLNLKTSAQLYLNSYFGG